MTPEREKLIRWNWSRRERDARQELLDRGALAMPLDPMERITGATLFAKVPPMRRLEVVTITVKVRELTWSAECEGLELATYRR